MLGKDLDTIVYTTSSVILVLDKTANKHKLNRNERGVIMNALLKKLNFKEQEKILIINAPEEFVDSMTEICEFTVVDTKPEKV